MKRYVYVYKIYYQRHCFKILLEGRGLQTLVPFYNSHLNQGYSGGVIHHIASGFFFFLRSSVYPQFLKKLQCIPHPCNVQDSSIIFFDFFFMTALHLIFMKSILFISSRNLQAFFLQMS